MIGRVADHVRERVFDKLKHLAVEFGFFALHHHFDALV